MIDHEFRRWLAEADDLCWQALSRPLARWTPTTVVSQLPPPSAKRERLQRVLIEAPDLDAAVGGAQTTMRLLARGLRRLGVDVTLRDMAATSTVALDAPYDATVWWGRRSTKTSGRSVYFVSGPMPSQMDELADAAHIVDHVVAASAECAEMARNVLVRGRSPASVSVAWNGAETPTVTPTRDGIDEETFGFLGRYSQQDKNVLGIVAAAAWLAKHEQHAEVTVLFFGDGPDRDLILRAAKAWEVESLIQVHGPTHPSEALAQIDALLLPSFREATPSVIAEAMRAGVPVIATPVGDIRAMQGIHLLVDPSPEAIASALQWRAIGANVERAEAFADTHLSVESMTAQWLVALQGGVS